MKRQRPVSIMVFAVANIALGLVGSLCGTCAFAIGMSEPSSPSTGTVPTGQVKDANTYDQLAHEAPVTRIANIIVGITIAILGLLAVISGIGMMFMQDWARVLAAVYAVLAILTHVSFGFFQAGYVYPIAVRLMIESNSEPDTGRPPPGALAGFSVGFLAPTILQIIVFVGHAIPLLMFMLAPATAAAFRTPDESEEPLVPDHEPAADFPS